MSNTTTTTTLATATPTTVSPAVDLTTAVGNSTSATYWPYVNYTITTEQPTLVITNVGFVYSWYSGFYYYLIVLLFLFMALTFIKLGINRRRAFGRQLARQRQQDREAAVANQGNQFDLNGGGAPANDKPPAYDEAMRAYLTKQQLPATESAAVGGAATITTTASTTTLETVLDMSVGGSDVNAATTSAVTGCDALRGEVVADPPSYQEIDITEIRTS